MMKLTTALAEWKMSMDEYQALVEKYDECGLNLFWSPYKKHWCVEQIGGKATYTHFKTFNMDRLRQVDQIRREFDEIAGQPRRPRRDAAAPKSDSLPI